jgi:acetate kinase
MTILALNCGSSSLKYALFDGETPGKRDVIDRIGSGGVADHAAAVQAILDGLAVAPSAVGHRIVHGGPELFEPALVDDALLSTLHRAVPFAPLHLPVELATIAAVAARFGGVPQVVCFDTGFHRELPEVARRYALPAELNDAGIRRYGFHGLSYEYVASVVPTRARAIFAHLGNGASMTAVRHGRSIDTTMGLTPAGGLVMGTRSGDLDPGVLIYLMTRGLDARAIDQLVEREAGMLALSETSSDMRRLLNARDHDPRARLAIDVFCYHVRKTIGAFAAALGGLDLIVFTGGIGERSASVRSAICRGLRHLGIELDADRNGANAQLISSGACEVRVVATDEERIIARHTLEVVMRGEAN